MRTYEISDNPKLEITDKAIDFIEKFKLESELFLSEEASVILFFDTDACILDGNVEIKHLLFGDDALENLNTHVRKLKNTIRIGANKISESKSVDLLNIRGLYCNVVLSTFPLKKDKSIGIIDYDRVGGFFII